MKLYRWIVLLGLPLLAACAGQLLESALPSDHPASPNAPESPRSDPSPTLQQDSQDERRAGSALLPPHEIEPAEQQDQGAHGAHGHSMSDMDRHGEAAEPAEPPPAPVYTCPMHPDVSSSEPGNCPKCGMRLVKKKVIQ